jgi:PAS domain S-box-containing protein
MRKDLLWSKALAETYDRSVNWNDDELNQFVLDQAVNLTESAIGYFHLISEDQQTIGFSMWNNEALKNCAPGNGGHQSVAKAGNWAECIRTKKPVIFNDYPGSPKQKGLPSGHVKLKRFLSVPVISGDKVMIVFGVGNKEANYDEFDSNHLQLLANDLYKIMVERHIKKVLEGAILFNRQIIHSARDGVVVYDKDLRYQVWNPYMEELTGIPSSRIIGKHPIEVFPFLKENGSLNRLERSLKGDNPSLFEFQFQTARQGISVWVSDKSAPIKDADGKIIGVISIVRDVTEKKLVEDTLRLLNERFDLAARTAMLGIWDWDIPSDTLYWDDRMYDLYGIHKKDFPDAYTAWQKGVHPDDRKRNSEVSQAALRGDCEYEMEFRIIWPDGKIRFIKAFGSVIRDAEGSPLRMTGMNYDITDLVEIQEALRKRDKELENMNRNLENRVQEEVKASMDKDITLVKQGRLAVMGEMIQYITHQWRQPLNNLGLLVQKLKDNNNGDGKRQDEIEIFANKSMDLVQYMSNTIDNFRNFFKKDKQKVSFRLSDITRTAVSIMEASLKNNSIKLEMQVDESVSLTGFPNELSQVILNVLNNSKEAFAVNKTASPKIIIQSTTNNGRTGLIVADNAGGIPESDIGKIFDSDYSTKETGTGIGLYMSKIIIEKNMNGSMSARNIPDGLEVKILF